MLSPLGRSLGFTRRALKLIDEVERLARLYFDSRILFGLNRGFFSASLSFFAAIRASGVLSAGLVLGRSLDSVFIFTLLSTILK